MGSTQGPGAHMGRGDPGLRDERARSDGSPSQCPWRLKKLVGGERGYNGSSAPCTPLENDTFLLWCPRFFLQTFPVVQLLTLVPSGYLFTANSCPLPGSVLQTPISSTQPPFATGDS